MNFKKLCSKSLLSASLVSILGVAQAGTMGPVGPSTNWAGFYAGLNAGGIWGHADYDWTVPAGSTFNIPQLQALAAGSIRDSGFTGGGQIGWNFEWDQLLGGIEGDFNWVDLEANRDATSSVIAPGLMRAVNAYTVGQNFSSDWLSTVRARLGLVHESWLLYATGGLAIANLQFWDTGDINSNTFTGSSDTTELGWTAGVGLEWKFASQWSAKVEYLYVDFGNVSFTTANTANAANTITMNHDFTANVARVGVNYFWG